MKNLNNYIYEALIKKNTKIKEYKYHPKDRNELKSLLKKLLEERGKDADLNDIDTSQITDMSLLFEDLDPHNIDISKWDVSNVGNMSYMFYRCRNFDCDLSKWNVSNVKDMWGMFYKCENFNSDLSKWDISKVKKMYNIFVSCTSLKNKPSWYKDW